MLPGLFVFQISGLGPHPKLRCQMADLQMNNDEHVERLAADDCDEDDHYRCIGLLLLLFM